MASTMRTCTLFLLVLACGCTEQWLTDNAQKEGVVTLTSGLQYKIIKSAPPGGAKPKKSEKCKCHYTGTLIDGEEFDSSRKRGKPATFKPSGVIAGWTEALQLMSPGDQWMLYIPARLGYGSRGAGDVIPADATLIFDIELIEILESGGFWDDISPDMMIGGVVVLSILYFLFNKGSGGGGGKSVSASHILVKQEAECTKMKELLDALKTPEEINAKFAELAKQYSSCPSGKSADGSLGTFAPGQMVPEFDKVCWSAPVGVVQGPVQTQFGFHLILVTSRSDPAEEASKTK